MFNGDGLVRSVCSLSDGAHSVQRRDTQGCREVAVRAAAGRCFVQRETEFGCQGLSLSEQSYRCFATLHGWAIETASDGETAACVGDFEGAE